MNNRRDPVDEQGLCQVCAKQTWQVERVRRYPAGNRWESVPEITRLCGPCFVEAEELTLKYE